MALTSLQNQFISASYGQLIQISGSELADGNGASLSSSLLNISASFADSVISSSHATNADSAISAVSASYATTASYALKATDVDNALVTASATDATITFTKGNASTFDVTVDNVANAVYSQNTITTGKNLEATEIAKGTPLYFTGSGTSGNLVGVYRADAGNPARMPAGGVAGEAIASGAEGAVLLDGFINGVNTAVFASGDKVYVGVGGGYTNVEPTGSNLIQFLGNVEKSAINGSGVIQMMGEARRLPNLNSGSVWVGDGNSVPQSVTTSSLSVALAATASYVAGGNVVGAVASATSASHALSADSADDVASTARLNITDITASNASFQSASIGYLESVTGSAKIIGDAFIIVNNNTPSERYAGLSVIDSGSAGTTASFQFDGQTNDWFYEYTGSDPLNFGVALFGPEYGTKGSPTYLTNNRIPKGDGGHHLNDSTITDDGSTVSIYAGATSGLTVGTAASRVQYGNVQIYTDSGTFPGNIYEAYQINDASNFDIQLENTTYSGLDGSNPVMRLRGGSNNGTDGNTIISSNTSDGYAKHHKQSVFLSPITASAAISGGAATFTVHGTSDFVKIDGNEQDALEIIGSVFIGSVNQRQNNPYNSFVQGEFNTIAGGAAGNSAIIGARSSQINGSANHNTIAGGLSNTIANAERAFIGGGDTNAVNADNAAVIGGTNNTVNHTGSVILGGNSTTSTAANTVYTPRLQVNDELSITGSAVFKPVGISIISTTASMDCSAGNVFSLQLASAVDTHLDATNLKAGQVINLKLTQNAITAGTISFAPEFKFPGGTPFTATTGLSAVDVLTFVSFDGSSLLATGLSDFS